MLGSRPGRGFGSGGGNASTIPMESDFSKSVNVIVKNVQKINQNISKIERLLTKIGTAQDGQRLRDDLQQLESESTQLLKDTTTVLKQVNLTVNQSNDITKKTQLDRLKTDVTQAVTSFKKVTEKAAEIQRENVEKMRSSSVGQDGELLIDTRTDTPYSHGQASSKADGEGHFQAQTTDTVDIELIEQREKAIKQLESDIVDVNEIFKDLATMVHEQGEIIDSIEANVDSAGLNVMEGNTHLQAAVKYQKKSRKKMICVIVLLVIVITVIAIIIWQSVPKPKT